MPRTFIGFGDRSVLVKHTGLKRNTESFDQRDNFGSVHTGTLYL